MSENGLYWWQIQKDGESIQVVSDDGNRVDVHGGAGHGLELIALEVGREEPLLQHVIQRTHLEKMVQPYHSASSLYQSDYRDQYRRSAPNRAWYLLPGQVCTKPEMVPAMYIV